jgi:hypothetical protein
MPIATSDMISARERLMRERRRTTEEQLALAISWYDLRLALLHRAEQNGDDQKRAFLKTLAACDTPSRVWHLRAQHYWLFLDEWGPEPDAESQWAEILDDALRDATLRRGL